MSRYGTVNTGAAIQTEVVQSATASDLQSRLTAVLNQLPATHVVVAITLSGAGNGQMFFATVEAAAASDMSNGGLTVAQVRAYAASEARALDRARARAAASAPAIALVDSQTAGSGDGHRVMGLLVFGVLAGTGGGQVIQSAFAYPQEPGAAQDVTVAGLTDVLDGNGARLEAVLPNPVRSNSIFRLGMYIGQVFPTVVGPNNQVSVIFRPLLFGPDDPNFPNNFNPLDQDYGLVLGSRVNTSSVASFGNCIISQAMIASFEGSPMVGRLGMFVRVALSEGAGADEARINTFPSGGGAGRVWLSVEELDPAGFTSTPTPP